MKRGPVARDLHADVGEALATDHFAAGLVNMELNRGDGSLGTLVGVQAGLDMRSIAMLGSEEQ